ncbi:DNA repair protein RecO [Tolypothrix tenuis PCC 7101]|uniref:DNA repair protein RecO n=1 Tax=Tolypothrix tenuis PCC 7101 TaxID=231146 RepID=A0A1Z4MW95_9CYAN|nr:DNA repair protein RecO [Aulosira sp. FACHB-113]BAY97734.1 DNA repair protein RecO [Tolypothrix tenuis PCC 7101]BAZ71759.1 DNA repair protein RecO [Aulosira laxa NIES-50]
MSKTYQVTGINLKAQALGESDRIVTILTKEFGLIRAVAPGARKHNSSLGGRSGMFVVNELLIAKGRSLDKITQAQTVKTYPGLTKDLGKLAASQYLAEIVLSQALSEQPQEELYELLNEHLNRLEAVSNNEASILAHLSQGVFHLLALAGLTPQVQVCCLTQRPLMPNFTNPQWQVGFSISAGGTVCLETWEDLRKQKERERQINSAKTRSPHSPPTPATTISGYQTVMHRQELPVISGRLNAKELDILQQLSQPEIMQISTTRDNHWLAVEQILRHYAQYHLGHPIRSATLIDSYFAANHDATV